MLRIDNKIRILMPLRIRDFRLLWIGESVSLLGDGIYYVALAWQVYALSNAPTALSAVGVAWTVPMVVFMLLSGVLSDRFDRRALLILSDVIRFVAVVIIGVLSITGDLELWHMFVFVAIYGIGDAFFGPSFGAIIPDLVPQHLLVEANSLGQFVRPLAERLLGPAVGGIVIAAAGEGNEGYAFLFDALTFVVSGACIYAITARKGAPSKERQGSMFSEVAEGLRFVKAHTWLWATLAAASLMLLFWVGPFEVLLPFVIKNNLASGADALGLVFAAGGVGSILVAVVMAQRGLPRRHMVFMYLSFAVAAGAVAGFAFVTTVWQAMIFGFIDGAAVSAGMIVWSTLMHRLVPRALLGRVQSLDWMVSTGLTPLSFALTGPLWKLVGLRATLIGAGALGAVAMLSFMVLPRLYDTEKDERMRIHGASRKPEPQWDHDGEEERDIEHSAKMSG